MATNTFERKIEISDPESVKKTFYNYDKRKITRTALHTSLYYSTAREE